MVPVHGKNFGGQKNPLPTFQALVQKGEKRHIFSDSMPATIQRSVNEENLQFMQHRDVYCPEYFLFIHRLTFCNFVSYRVIKFGGGGGAG